MADLREKIVSRKQNSFVIKCGERETQRSIPPWSESGTLYGGRDERDQDCHQRRNLQYSLQDVWSEESRDRRKIGPGETYSGNARARKFARKSLNTASFRSNNDIDIRNDPEFRFGSGNSEAENCEKIYEMAKGLKCRHEKLNNVLDENENLRCQIKDSSLKLNDAQTKLIKFEEELEDVKGKLVTREIDNDSDRVLIKDLVFENENKRKYIENLENEIRDLKKTKSKLLAENVLIRKLGKQISDDSDNLLEIITKLKQDKDAADEKIVLLEWEKAQNSSGNREVIENIGLKIEDVQEVNESLDKSWQMAALNDEINVGQDKDPNPSVDENDCRQIVNHDNNIDEDIDKEQSIDKDVDLIQVVGKDENMDKVCDKDIDIAHDFEEGISQVMDENENVDSVCSQISG